MSPRTPQEVVERTLALSRSDGCVAILVARSTANLRFAANTLTTNGLVSSAVLTVIATVTGPRGTSAGVVSRAVGSADDLEPVVRAAEAAARASAPADDAQPLVSPGGDRTGSAFADPPGHTSFDTLAGLTAALSDVFGAASADGVELFGYAEHTVTTTFLASSTGLRLRYDRPGGRLEVNGKSHGRKRSAWAGAVTRDFSDVDPAAVDAELRRRLRWAEREVQLPAGRYETILPPVAVTDLMLPLYWRASARDAAEGRTVFSRPGGGTLVGEPVAGLPLNLGSDPGRPGLECPPFVVARASGGTSSVFDNGLPIAATDWVHAGRLAALMQTRHSAAMTGLPVTPAIGNLVLEHPGATASLRDMVASTRRGLLLTCLWYIREVDPQTLLLTGLTRDGVYLVEDGEVTAAVNNFRFNESPLGILRRASEVGITPDTSISREWGDEFVRAAMPPVRVPDFLMSTVSPAS